MSTIEMSIEAELTIEIKDGIDWRWYTDPVSGEKEWRGDVYGLVDDEAIHAHWAHNAASNGVTDVNSLDGWADLPRGAVTFRIQHVSVES